MHLRILWKCLAVFVVSGIRLPAAGNDWMSTLDGSLWLSQLTIPGTHDSGARYEPWPGTAKCQDLSIAEQLEAGVRFLDIRCRHSNNAFAIYHSYVSQNLSFDSVVADTYQFLQSHPGETVIMSIMEEYTPENNSRSFEETFDAYVAANPNRWRLAESIPTLDEARGKIVLLRRFPVGNTPKGIAASPFSDNTTFSIGTTLRVQDRYQVSSNDSKWSAIAMQFNEARYGGPNTLYLNFCSGYTTGLFGIPNLTGVASNINGRLDSYFNQYSGGRFGVVIMDFANASRCSNIFGKNAPNHGTAAHPAVFQIINRATGKALSVASGFTAQGVPVLQRTLSSTDPDQRWSFAPSEASDRLRLAVWSSPRSLSVEYGSTSSGANLQASDYGGNDEHWFELVHTDSGFYRLRYPRSGLVVEVQDASNSDYGRIQQAAADGSEKQQWWLKPWGEYVIRADNGKYLTTGSDGSVDRDTIVQQTYQPKTRFSWWFSSPSFGKVQATSSNAPTRAIGLLESMSLGGIPAWLADRAGTYSSWRDIRLLPKTDGRFEVYFLHSNLFWNIYANSTAEYGRLEQAWEGPVNSRSFYLERLTRETTRRFVIKPRQTTDPAAGTVTLTWPSRSGWRYRPQRAVKLDAWSEIGASPFAGDGGLLSIQEALPMERTFYQVIEELAE